MKKSLVRIYHPWNMWECFQKGFFGPYPSGMNKDKGEALYRDFFRTEGLFEKSLGSVLKEWKHSCEHNLTNPSLNKIAWGGQTACCLALGVPADCRAGYNLLNKEEQKIQDDISERLIRAWYEEHGYEQPKKLSS